MRWLDATPRRAAPKGHETFISHAVITSSHRLLQRRLLSALTAQNALNATSCSPILDLPTSPTARATNVPQMIPRRDRMSGRDYRVRRSWCRDARSLLPRCRHAASTALMQSTKGGFNHQEAEGKRNIMNDRTLDRTGVDACREIAEELERQHPRWIVIFGAFTREFVCLPRFAVPPGFRVVAIYPEAAADRMSKVERLCRVQEGLSTVSGGSKRGRARRDHYPEISSQRITR